MELVHTLTWYLAVISSDYHIRQDFVCVFCGKFDENFEDAHFILNSDFGCYMMDKR